MVKLSMKFHGYFSRKSHAVLQSQLSTVGVPFLAYMVVSSVFPVQMSMKDHRSEQACKCIHSSYEHLGSFPPSYSYRKTHMCI